MTNGPAKKPYTPPSLVVYGDIGQITKAVGKSGNADAGGMEQMDKTGP
jgi:hypothetical protein